MCKDQGKKKKKTSAVNHDHFINIFCGDFQMDGVAIPYVVQQIAKIKHFPGKRGA